MTAFHSPEVVFITYTTLILVL